MFIITLFVSPPATEKAAPKPKAIDSLIIVYSSWDSCSYSRVCWTVYVLNQSNVAIKDLHFKMYYYAQSGTVISTGEETIYEVINSGEKRCFKFDEFLRDQVVKAKVEIENALWLHEEGKVYLDW